MGVDENRLIPKNALKKYFIFSDLHKDFIHVLCSNLIGGRE